MPKTRIRLIVASTAVTMVLVTVVFWPIPKFEVSSLNLSKPEAFVGEDVIVSAEIKCAGNAYGTYKAVLRVNDAEVENEGVRL